MKEKDETNLDRNKERVKAKWITPHLTKRSAREGTEGGGRPNLVDTPAFSSYKPGS